MPSHPPLRLLLAGIAIFFATIALGQEPPKGDLFVSPDGNDAWTGELPDAKPDGSDGPLASIGAARDAIRRIKAEGKLAGPLRVVIRGGTYSVDGPIVFGAEDSGTENAPITYAASPGEIPIISSGRPIGGWKREGDGPIWTTTVPQVKNGEWEFWQLFVDGQRCTPARTPNDDFFHSAGPGAPNKDRTAARRDPKAKISIRYQGEDLKEWSNLGDAIVVVYHSWTASRHRIKSLDTEAKLVEFTAPSGWPMGYWDKNQRYYVEFVREELDAPGEWYLDRKTGELSYYPLPGQDMTKVRAVAPSCEELLRLEGDPAAGKLVSHLTFDGLSFQHTGWTMPEAATVDGQAAAGLTTATVYCLGARNCLFKRCEIAHTGGYGLWLQRGCKDNRVDQCHIHDLGAGGVRLGETALPAEPEQQTERNTVHNSFIHDGGNVYHAGIGVWLGRTSHNNVTHNDICQFLYTGVSVGWSWGYAPSTANHNLIEYNHIHHLGYGQLSDMGGIYCLGLSPGTKLRHNLIHDVLSYAYGGWGLYTDEGSTGILMENNVVYRVKDGAFHQHYGRDNLVRNNVLALSATYGQIRRSREEEHNSFTVERNVIYSDGVTLLGGNWKNGNFTMKGNCYFDASSPEPKFPGGASLKEWQAKGHDTGSIVADPKFADPGKCDFSLPADSPAVKLGFVPIDVSECGLVGPAEWVAFPKRTKLPPIEMPKAE